jgi:hypothetical protein
MSRITNTDIERFYFSRFVRDIPLPDGTIEYGDKPDVIVRGDRVIGIEIARLYITPGTDPSSEQVQKAKRAECIAQAQKRYLASGGKRFEWTFGFNPQHPILDVKVTAGRLFDLARSTDNFETGAIRRRAFASVEELAFAYLYAKECENAQWRVAQVHSVPSLQHHRVREVVASKDALRAGYAPCDRYWLLLVVDLMDRAQDQEIEWHPDEEPVRTEYERVIIYKPQYRRVAEVPVARAG